MTPNQIIIPLALLALAIFVTLLLRHNRRQKQMKAQIDHRPNAPDTGHDKAEIARSAMSGVSGNDYRH